MTENDDSGSPDRRTVLKLIGGAAGAAATLPGGAAASADAEQEKRNSLKSEFAQPEKAAEAIRQNGNGILSYLKGRGILETIEVTDLVSKSIQNPVEHQKSPTGIAVSSFTFGDEYSARVSTTIGTESHTVELFIHPHVDIHYAVVKPSDDDQEPFVVESTDDGPEPQDLCKQDGEICRYEGNDYDCCPPLLGCNNTAFEKIICRSGDCYAGSHTNCCNLPSSC